MRLLPAEDEKELADALDYLQGQEYDGAFPFGARHCQGNQSQILLAKVL